LSASYANVQKIILLFLSSFGLPRKNKKKKKKKSSIGPASDGAGFHTTNISEKKEQLIRATFILKSKQ
jgi:hypothetical protein